jgi:diaminopimelate epimerase
VDEVAFAKYHALGNDYLVIDPRASPLALPPEELCALVVRLCDRHRGVGADGVVLGPFFDADDGSDGSGQMRIRIFNPDGSEAEKSGNGIRIFARYAFEAGYVSGTDFALATRGGVVAVWLLNAQASLIEVDMGTPSFRSGAIPMTGPEREVVDEPLSVAGHELRVTCVSIGNPHCVIFGEEVTPARAQRLGPLVERAPCFPQRTNTQLARVVDERTVIIEIWERGVGYTLASGSSSCAVASAARRLGLVGEQVTVRMPGGTLAVAFASDGHALLTGPVTGVAHGTAHRDLLGLPE